jgi:hypothetical protein
VVVLDTLIETYQAGSQAKEDWVMGIYKRDFTGGHAITPFAVEDKGNGIFHILIYDNNWPSETRFVEVVRNKNTWRYHAATNPNEPSELYEGDGETQTLELNPISPRLVQQDCDFCAGGGLGHRAPGLAAQEDDLDYNQIWLTGPTNLIITDEEGNRTGKIDGEYINEIPGARVNTIKFGTEVWDLDREPSYQIPVGVAFALTVDATDLTEPSTTTVAMIGPGYDLVVEDIYLDPGTEDTITFAPDGRELSYSTEYTDAPDMIFGVETDEADYEFIVAALDIEAGAEFFVYLDAEEGDLSINTDGTHEFGIYEIVMLRIDDEGEQWFQNDDIQLEPGDTATLNFLEWEGPGSTMFIDIDYESDGEIDESIELVDEYVAGGAEG